MPRESQTERSKSLIASITELGHTSEDANRLPWHDLNIPEVQSTQRPKPTIDPEILGNVLENINEYPSLKSEKQASVKFGFAPMPRSFNLPAVFSVYINTIGRSPQSLVVAVELLVSIVGEDIPQSSTSLTSEDYQRLTKAQGKLIDIVGADENHFLIPLINFIGNLIKIRDEESNSSADLLAQETDDPEHADAATLKPHRPEKVGRPATPSRLKLTDLLSQETDDLEHTDTATLKPHRPEKVGRPATLPRLKLTDLLSQETDDSASDEIDTGPAVGNEA